MVKLQLEIQIILRENMYIEKQEQKILYHLQLATLQQININRY